MLSANDNSYMKEYVRRSRARSSRGGAENVRPGGAAGERLLTDRGEYIKFLESQLDAVTQACLTAQSFDERIVSLGAAAVAHDEKIRTHRSSSAARAPEGGSPRTATP